MRDNAPFSGKPTAADEKAAIDNIPLSFFEAWIDKITAPGAERDTEMLKPVMQLYGVRANSGLCAMYEAFVAGICAGLDLVHEIDRIAAEAKKA